MDVVLADVPAELRPLVVKYAENLAEANRLRGELSTLMTAHDMRWFELNATTHRLVAATDLCQFPSRNP